MNAANTYLKMSTPADMLVAHYFSTSGQLKGKFVQEINPPWGIWWEFASQKGWIDKIGGMIKGNTDAPEKVWQIGKPKGALKEVSWLDLFRKSVIREEQTKSLSQEVIVFTSDRDLFFDIVRRHFLLSQGEISFTTFESSVPYYLLKIINPSLWVFKMIPQDTKWRWFNQVDKHSGLFVEAGYYIHDITGDSVYNKFQMLDQGILLVQKDGRIVTIQPKWKQGEQLIKIDCPDINIPEKEETEKIVLPPKLRKTDEKLLHKLWKVKDISRFKAILANESLERFKGYSAWYTNDGNIWVIALKEYADRGLASIFSDAFESFVEIDSRLFTPAGTTLSPKLAPSRLAEIFDFNNSSWICFENKDDRVGITILPRDILREIKDFIFIEAEQAINTAEELKSNWNFDFPELKKKKLIFELEVENIHLEATTDKDQVGAAARAKRKAEISEFKLRFDQIPVYKIAKKEINAEEILRIDHLLMTNVFQSQLWKKRGEISKSLGKRNSWLVSLMTGAILEDNTSLLAQLAIEFVRKNPTCLAIFSENVDETGKGKLLATIRKSHLEAEFQYVALLIFAARFNDFDIFQQAVDSMKSGFVKDQRQFFSFSETKYTSANESNSTNKVELLTEEELPRIKRNTRNFLQYLGSCGSLEAIALVRNQFALLLSHHLSPAVSDKICKVYQLDQLGGTGYRAHEPSATAQFFWKKLKNWTPLHHAKDNSPVIQRWIDLVVMDKIKDTPLRDFFTGDLYRPPFMFRRQTQNGMPTDLSQIHWIDALDRSDFPMESDGKPIARAIFTRYSDGYDDWADFFKLALNENSAGTIGGLFRSVTSNKHSSNKKFETIAKAQRLLLLMVSEYGPIAEFEQYIMPPSINKGDVNEAWDIYRLIMYCDMFRLHLAYKKQIDEQRLFNLLIKSTPAPGASVSFERQGYGSWDDVLPQDEMKAKASQESEKFFGAGYDSFRYSAEWLILSLLLSSSPVRRFQLDNLLKIASSWLKEAVKRGRKKQVAEVLNIITFLEIGTLADLVPEKLELHQLNERRKVIWLKQAFKFASDKNKSWNNWQKACDF